MPIAKTVAELPQEYTCRCCGLTKPISEMILIRRRKTSDFMLRPRCKECHNKREQGHRREWKRKYLKLWRKRNPELNDSYWRDHQVENRPKAAERARRQFRKHHAAILIQGRLRRRLGMSLSLKECKELARKYGPCYPTKYGLTPAGLRECERIRSSMRRTGKRISTIEVRMMLYEDGYYITPKNQPIPYKKAANRLREWQAKRKTA
jgi:hypothetical protein